MNPTLTKNFTASGVITKRRIVKFGTTDTQVSQAAAATDAMFGISAELDAADAERVDIHVQGLLEVEYGGTVTRGDLLTSDANGKAIIAAPAAGVNNRIIGTAIVSGVIGDIGAVQLTPGHIQGQ